MGELEQIMGELHETLTIAAGNREQYETLRKGIEQVEGTVKLADTAYKNCDHSETKISMDARYTAIMIKEGLPSLYKFADSVKDPKTRAKLYKVLNHIAYLVGAAISSAKGHLTTEKQSPLVQEVLRKYHMSRN